MTFTQTAEQAEAKVLRFVTRAECVRFIEAHSLRAMVHHSTKGSWIAICYLTAGVFAVSSPTTCELLADW